MWEKIYLRIHRNISQVSEASFPHQIFNTWVDEPTLEPGLWQKSRLSEYTQVKVTIKMIHRLFFFPEQTLVRLIHRERSITNKQQRRDKRMTFKWGDSITFARLGPKQKVKAPEVLQVTKGKMELSRCLGKEGLNIAGTIKFLAKIKLMWKSKLNNSDKKCFFPTGRREATGYHGSTCHKHRDGSELPWGSPLTSARGSQMRRKWAVSCCRVTLASGTHHQ